MHSEIESRKEQADEECTREIVVKLMDEQSKVQELQNALQIVRPLAMFDMQIITCC